MKFICDTKIQTPMKEVKQKVMCQHDTKAAKSCTNFRLYLWRRWSNLRLNSITDVASDMDVLNTFRNSSGFGL